jgi:hypothetical protein
MSTNEGSYIMQGVVICVTSLVMALAQDNLDAYAVCYTKAVDRLQKVGILSFGLFLIVTLLYFIAAGH